MPMMTSVKKAEVNLSDDYIMLEVMRQCVL